MTASVITQSNIFGMSAAVKPKAPKKTVTPTTKKTSDKFAVSYQKQLNTATNRVWAASVNLQNLVYKRRYFLLDTLNYYPETTLSTSSTTTTPYFVIPDETLLSSYVTKSINATATTYSYNDLVKYLQTLLGKDFEAKLKLLTSPSAWTSYGATWYDLYISVYTATVKLDKDIASQKLALAQHQKVLNDVKSNKGLSTAAIDKILAKGEGTTKDFLNSIKGDKLNSIKGDKEASKAVVSLPVTNPKDYKWNLPPHSWSLPINASTMMHGNDSGLLEDATRFNQHKLRRGIIWTAVAGDEQLGTPDPKTGKVTKAARAASKYGFQFMWNPAEFQSNVAVNFDITPNANDFFATSAFAYPTSSTITLTLMLDRTNDFACFKKFNLLTSSLNVDLPTPHPPFAHFYTHQYPSTDPDPVPMVDRGYDLLKYGTLSDIEYLYKAVNGEGWKNKINGRITSDIGWLRPTLMGIQLGPTAYFCIIESISINHTSFTPAMIPVRSEVTLSLSLKSNVALSSNPSSSNLNLAPGTATP